MPVILICWGLVINTFRWRKRRDLSWRRIVLRSVPQSLSWRSSQLTSPDLWWGQTETVCFSPRRCCRFTPSLTPTKTGGSPTPWSSSSPAPRAAVWSSTWCTQGARSTSSGRLAEGSCILFYLISGRPEWQRSWSWGTLRIWLMIIWCKLSEINLSPQNFKRKP